MRISNLSNKSGNPTSGDYLVLDDGTTVTKIDYNKLAKAIIENYAASTLAGSAQSVKAAIDSLNSNMIAIYQTPGVAISAGSWVADPFGLPTPSGNRYILSVYDGDGNFGFLMKRSTDNKIYSSIALRATNAIGISGVAK